MDLIRHVVFVVIHDRQEVRGSKCWETTTTDMAWAISRYDGILLHSGESKELVEIGRDGAEVLTLRQEVG